MISPTMGKSPRTGRRLLPPMYSGKDQTQETTCTVQSCCYLHGRVMLMIGQIQQQQVRKHPISKNRNNVLQTRILIWNSCLYESGSIRPWVVSPGRFCSILLFLPSYTVMSVTSRHDVGYYCYMTFVHYYCLIKHKYQIV